MENLRFGFDELVTTTERRRRRKFQKKYSEKSYHFPLYNREIQFENQE